MAVEVLTDVRVEIATVVLSDHARKATVSYSAAMLDHNTFGFDTKRNIAGLKDWSIVVEFENDYAAGSVDATLFGLVGAAAFSVLIRKSTAAKSATNPEFAVTNGALLAPGYSPIDAAQGSISTATATFVPGGATPTLARNIA